MLVLLSNCYTTRGKRVLLFVFAILALHSNAQRYSANTYTIADGLENSSVFDLVQDTSGLIWFATQSGISSFDGTEFTNYGINDSLEYSGYIHLIVDQKGKLWALPINTNSRLGFFEGNNWKFIENIGLKNMPDRNISFDVAYIKNDLIIVIATNDSGLLLYKVNKWQKLRLPSSFSKSAINTVIIEDGKVYVATDRGILILQNFDTLVFTELNTHCPSKSVQSICFGPGHKLWMNGENWLGYYQDGKYKTISTSLSLKKTQSSGSSFIYATTFGEVYIGNYINLYCYSEKFNTVELFTRNKGLVSDGATAVLNDRENNLWITSYRGVTKIASRSFCSFTKSDGLTDNEIASAVEVSPGNFIFGHHGAITYYDGNKFLSQSLDNSPKSTWHEKRVMDLVKDKKGNIWAAATTLGIARINKRHEVKWYRGPQGVKGRVNSVAVVDDDRIICATSNGIFEKKGERFTPYRLNIALRSQIRKILPGKGKGFYLATVNEGLIEVNGTSAVSYKSESSDKGNCVFSVYEDSRKRTWIGTYDGLYRKVGNSLRKVDDKGLSIHYPVYLILEDKLNRLWFGTNNGLFRWDHDKLFHFTVSDGLAGQEINRSAGVVDEKNYLWIGTNNGLILYRPEYDYVINYVLPPKVKVIGVVAGKTSFAQDQPIELGSYSGDVIFNFRVLSYIDRNQMYFKYKLEGLDKEWSKETKFRSNELRISNLSPGRYQFFIKVCNAYGVWSEPVSSPVIIIDKPFWSRWWFLTLIILVTIGGLFLAVRYAFMARTKNRLEHLVAMRTRELSLSEDRLRNMNTAKDTFFSVISHDLRSPYNSLLGMLDILIADYSSITDEKRMSLLRGIKGTADRSFELLENLLTWARVQKGLIPYKPELFALSEVIQENLHLMESSIHKKGIQLNFQGSQKMNVFADKNMISTIVRNLLSNAIKFTYPDGKISISIHKDGYHQVIFAITDDGDGISLKKQEKLFKIDSRISTKGTSNETGSGMGLILCKEFIEINNGKIWIKSETGTGSTFYFALPSQVEI